MEKQKKEFEARAKYPLLVEWNKFIRGVKDAQEAWESLQRSLEDTSNVELEERYPDYVQKKLNLFRRMEFHWMMPLFIEYYRGSGGLMEMFLPVPAEPKKSIKEALLVTYESEVTEALDELTNTSKVKEGRSER